MRYIYGNEVQTISDLKKFYKDGVPYNSKYRLSMSLPTAIGQTLDSRDIDIACQSAEIPKSTVKTQKVWFRGRPLNIKGQLSYDDNFKITVQDSGHFKIRKFFEKWIYACDNLEGKSIEDYTVKEVYLYHLDTLGKPTIKTTFYNVFLSELGSIQLNDKSTDLITYDCNFTYSTFESEVLE